MTIEQARAYAIQQHGNQQYGNRPYSYHLDAVAAIASDYGETATIVAYLHDVVEDTPATQEELEQQFGLFVSQCVSILTDEPGSNRKEKKAKTYAKMAAVRGDLELALIIKTADRLANINACIETNHQKKLQMYKEEHPVFKQAVYREGLCNNLWFELDAKINQ